MIQDFKVNLCLIYGDTKPFSWKGSKTRYKREKKKKDKRVREGVVKEEKFPHSRKSSHRCVCEEFWNLRRQHNQEKKQTNKKNTEYTPNCNYGKGNFPAKISNLTT